MPDFGAEHAISVDTDVISAYQVNEAHERARLAGRLTADPAPKGRGTPHLRPSRLMGAV